MPHWRFWTPDGPDGDAFVEFEDREDLRRRDSLGGIVAMFDDQFDALYFELTGIRRRGKRIAELILRRAFSLCSLLPLSIFRIRLR